METKIIDGKRIAAEVREEVRLRVEKLRAKGVEPGLCVILVGDDPASQVYVRNKDRAATKAGFQVETVRLPADVGQEELEQVIFERNANPSVHGILVQLPLPPGLDPEPLLRALDPRKDVDGLGPANVAALWRGQDGMQPCTPAGCIELLERSGVTIEGRRAVIVGRSPLVGKPLAALLLNRNATVTICHSRTQDLARVTREADILVAAVGRAEMVRGSWIKPGACVLDVGINRGEDGRLRGDVAFAEAREIASKITPVPGGVGPMTIAMLLSNTARAAANLGGLDPDSLD
ncbi:MAG TPA: bifunctional methylenetetrahydrofolate dehydrogenase/methenyltetrahydrofolate cyclohydrolase FolD [Planctomycetes bacterium]|nr:bifunctional methylenetetrahydrofolate dehydrogenase/methenyltetrahydrofolate cyclohydrolase FolD [Planctomycetota bacterium]